MNKFNDSALALVDGHVLIKDIDTGDVLLDKHNAINFENIAVAIASLLGGATDAVTSAGFTITNMAFGNGGTSIDGTGSVSYKTPNTDTASGTLYNATYTKDVSDNTDLDNRVTVVKYDGQVYSDVIVTCTLDYNDPITSAGSFAIGTEYTIVSVGTGTPTDFTLIGATDSNPGTVFTATGAGTGDGTATSQSALDNSSSMTGEYIFDEIGLINEAGKYISHIVFHPIQKSANRKIQVIYTLRIRAGS